MNSEIPNCYGIDHRLRESIQENLQCHVCPYQEGCTEAGRRGNAISGALIATLISAGLGLVGYAVYLLGVVW